MRHLLAPFVLLLALLPAGSVAGGKEAQLTPLSGVAVDILAFIREGDIWLINADGTGERRMTQFAGTGREVTGFDWLAGGPYIAYRASPRREPGAPAPALVTHVLADTLGTALWSRALPASSHVFWSPDGRLVALRDEVRVQAADPVSVIGAPWNVLVSSLRLIDRLAMPPRLGSLVWTTGLVVRVDESGGGWRVSWSRDGRSLAFIDGENIVVLSGDPPTERRLAMFSAGCPPLRPCPQASVHGGLAFSPDGNSLVVSFTRDLEIAAGGNAPFSLYAIDLQSEPVAEPFRFPGPGPGTGREEFADFGSLPPPVFSPDGQYVGYRRSIHLSACEAYARVVVLPVDGTGPRAGYPTEISEALRTFEPAGPDASRGPAVFSSGFDWSPRSDEFAVNFQAVDCSGSGFSVVRVLVEGLYILRADGTAEEKLADEFSFSKPIWSPSGTLIAYESAGPDGPVIRVIDRATRRVRDLAQGTRPAWQISAVRLGI